MYVFTYVRANIWMYVCKCECVYECVWALPDPDWCGPRDPKSEPEEFQISFINEEKNWMWIMREKNERKWVIYTRGDKERTGKTE